jgi:hypothetical protein
MKIIVSSRDCEDGNCPKISDVDDGPDDMVAIQGPIAPVRDGVPDHESVVLVPRQMVLEYADRFRAEVTN